MGNLKNLPSEHDEQPGLRTSTAGAKNTAQIRAQMRIIWCDCRKHPIKVGNYLLDQAPELEEQF